MNKKQGSRHTPCCVVRVENKTTIPFTFTSQKKKMLAIQLHRLGDVRNSLEDMCQLNQKIPITYFENCR